MSLTIGILTDGEQVPVWVQQLLNQLQQLPGVEIRFVVQRASNSTSDTNTSKTVYRILRAVDRKLFSAGSALFRKTQLQLNKEVPVLSVRPLTGTFTDDISAADCEQIRSFQPDLLLRFGFRILKGEILQAARYGILSLHHGDAYVNRGGPPAFWEVVKKEEVTGVTLQLLSSELDGGMVLGQAFTRTDVYSFNRNQSALYAAGIELFVNEIKIIASQGADSYFNQKRKEQVSLRSYDRPLYKDPGNFTSFCIAVKLLYRNMNLQFSKLLYRKQWVLYCRFRKNGELSLAPYQFKKLKVPGDRIWADPFPVKYENGYVVFFEEKFWNRKEAQIACIHFSDKGIPYINSRKVVVEEPFHLSYPFILHCQNQWYMIPESADANEVILYQAVSFPYKWERKKTLLRNVKAFDSTIIEHEGRWYLFCTVQKEKGLSPHAYLHIYHSDDPVNGEWKAHPMNPVYSDVRSARPAGKLFRHKGMLIRPAQQGAPVYGYAVKFFEVVKLSATEFEERWISSIEPLWEKNLIATHTFNNEGGLTVMDVQVKRRKF